MKVESVAVYILQSEDDNFYCGITNNLTRRIEEHKNGMSKYTRRYRGWKLLWWELLEDRKQARLMEVKIKNAGVRRWYEKHKPASSAIASLACGRDA
jgi:putative endonuclease